MTAPVASGWSVRRVGLAPTGKRRLVTAHTYCGPSRSPVEVDEFCRPIVAEHGKLPPETEDRRAGDSALGQGDDTQRRSPERGSIRLRQARSNRSTGS
jgi:hypothetical protein